MVINYKNPVFAVGDLVGVRKEDPNTKSVTFIEAYVKELQAKRDKDIFTHWTYGVELLTKSGVEYYDEDSLQGKMVVMRQYSKRM